MNMIQIEKTLDNVYAGLLQNRDLIFFGYNPKLVNRRIECYIVKDLSHADIQLCINNPWVVLFYLEEDPEE